MDGNLFSLYPYVDDLCTLTHVKHTPLGRYCNLQDARDRIDALVDSEVSGVRSKIEEHVSAYFPAFRDFFEYKSYYTGIKTKGQLVGQTRE